MKMLPASAGLRNRKIVAKRRPNIRRAARICERKRGKTFGEDANNLKRYLVHQNCLAECIWICAKTPDPVRMTQNDDVPPSGAVLFGDKAPAERGRSTKRFKEVVGHTQPVHNFG